MELDIQSINLEVDGPAGPKSVKWNQDKEGSAKKKKKPGLEIDT